MEFILQHIATIPPPYTYYIDMLQLTATAYPLMDIRRHHTSRRKFNSKPLTIPRTKHWNHRTREVYINSVIKTNGIQQYLINSADGDGNNQTILLDDTSNNLTISTKASAGATTVSYADF